MTTKTYLNQIAKIDTIIKNREIEIERFREMAQSITAPIDQERVQTSGTADIVGNNVVAFVNEEKQLEADKQKLLQIRREIVSQMEEIPNRFLYDILFLRYVSLKTIEEISYEKCRTVRQIKNRHAEALEIFEKLHGEKYLDKKVERKFEQK